MSRRPKHDEAHIIRAAKKELRGALPSSYGAWVKLAARHGVSFYWLRSRLDPKWGAHRRAQIRRCRQSHAKKSTGFVAAIKTAASAHDPISPAELVARLQSIPEDSRSLTGKLLGDPLPGRSALDQRGGA